MGAIFEQFGFNESNDCDAFFFFVVVVVVIVAVKKNEIKNKLLGY